MKIYIRWKWIESVTINECFLLLYPFLDVLSSSSICIFPINYFTLWLPSVFIINILQHFSVLHFANQIISLDISSSTFYNIYTFYTKWFLCVQQQIIAAYFNVYAISNESTTKRLVLLALTETTSSFESFILKFTRDSSVELCVKPHRATSIHGKMFWNLNHKSQAIERNEWICL